MNEPNQQTLSDNRRALTARCGALFLIVGLALGAFAVAAPAASAKDATYDTTVRVKHWDDGTRRDAAQQAANKGCRDGDHHRATVRVREGRRTATYKFDCVAGTAIDL